VGATGFNANAAVLLGFRLRQRNLQRGISGIDVTTPLTLGTALKKHLQPLVRDSASAASASSHCTRKTKYKSTLFYSKLLIFYIQLL